MRDMKTILYYDEEGEKNKNIILFLHSKNLANLVFDEQRNFFKKYHCIYLNLPNHYKNPKNSIFTIKKASENIKDFIKPKKKGEINLIGIGLGGQIAIELLSNYPELINKVIISGVETIDNEEWKSKKDSIINILDKTKDILDSKNVEFLTLAYLRYFNMKKSYYKKIFKCFEKESLENTKNISYESFNYRLNLHPKDPSREILICYGTKEDKRCKSSAYDIKSVFMNSIIMEVYKGVHLWNMKKGELFNQIALDYFNNRELI